MINYDSISIKTLKMFFIVNSIAGLGGILSSIVFHNIYFSFAIVIQLFNILVSITFYFFITKVKKLFLFKIMSLSYYVTFILIGMWYQLGSAHPMFIVYSVIVGQVIIMIYKRVSSIIFTALYLGLILILVYIDMIYRVNDVKLEIFSLGRLVGVSVIISGILITIYYNKDKMMRLIEELNVLNRVDSLTGAWNSCALYEDLDVFENDFIRKSINYVLVFIDLDEFKLVNDKYGHQRGDTYLVSFVASIMRRLRNSDKFYRIGGDEFVAIIREEEHHNVKEILDDINRNMNNTDANNVKMKFSYGSMSRKENDVDGNELIRRADELMYEKKSKNKLMNRE
ncbi:MULTISPECIES: GGDEF domain-containing protein [unclassified Fusibacter]|uniref:GGDEF domain-containing protein n=1 Tax=unclassified Fusibacter TaxID=2624464 RepID=UPI0010124E9D|nr:MULTISPECIES: GGDEF domain-containing protein [unclassified Fusibacter]MCK8060910.1 GGDEF domain-containing protein [Fusibacter sp. A2]NPE23206.1 GGDEF domain-containing protein [Fusibacter sp. A1]RXV59562.1 GGDEF domain-containing protein [Fusibacter sp. A1]